VGLSRGGLACPWCLLAWRQWALMCGFATSSGWTQPGWVSRLGDQVTVGEQLVFCERNADAARADLMRMCVALRDEVESHEAPRKQLCGALYVSCSGRGGPHFGAPSAELQWVRRALGDVPLVGFFAGGEIAGRQLYGYTGVLTVFVSDVTDSSSAPL
jgi:small ligand-binding sensory domain FIST